MRRLDRAVAAAVTTVAMNAGQVCSATTRLLVESSVHDEVVGRVVEAVERLTPDVDFGPMITEAQFHKVLETFAAARAEGAVPATGGSAYDEGPGADGLYIRPTVYSGVGRDLRITREEIFGPVLVTMPFDDESDALESRTTPSTAWSPACGAVTSPGASGWPSRSRPDRSRSTVGR